jgi:hypothetical protein
MQIYRSRGLFAARSKFTGGSGVLWHPTPVRSIPTPLLQGQDSTSSGLEKTYGWLAQRQPPTRHQSAVLDITEQLRSRESFTVLWDSRWLCEFSENAIDAICDDGSLTHIMTNESARLAIAPRDQWWTPSVAYKDGLNARWSHLTSLVLSHSTPPPVVMTFVRSIDAI